jgi:hypothetical protein
LIEDLLEEWNGLIVVACGGVGFAEFEGDDGVVGGEGAGLKKFLEAAGLVEGLEGEA